jgi:hypothetical protein
MRPAASREPSLPYAGHAGRAEVCIDGFIAEKHSNMDAFIFL